MAAAHIEWDTLSDQFNEIAEETAKSVVAVHGGRRVAGSGIMWRAGVVVTASHMVRRTEDIEVTFADKSRGEATFVGRDPGTDLAVLRLDVAGTATPAQLGDSANICVGQLVLAVGRSTLGDLAASAGIVARTGAAWQTWRGGRIDSLLRPDVTLYPGQSGSALVDSRGNVLGINTTALARASTITVPTVTVERVISEILEHGGVFRAYLGLAMQPVALPAELASKLRIQRDAALMIMQVEPASPSAEAGMTLGDLIIGINGQPVSGIDDVQRVLLRAKRGDSVELEYARGGQVATVKMKLAERPRR
jgi:S1-C subfamily serine protease